MTGAPLPYRPLAGVKVLDLARLIPGDLATQRLADLGADVVKVEEPGVGDYLRLIPPAVDGISVHHWNLNRGKRSIALDLKNPADRGRFDALAQVADVIVEVSVPGRFAALGLDFAALCEQRPDLVVCSITGFGQDGPFATLPSHGMNMDALAGDIIITERNGRPIIDYSLSASIASELGAANAALAVTAAVLGVKAGRGGAWIDVSCWDAGMEMHRGGLVREIAGLKSGEDLADAVLYAPYRCADGKLFIFCAIEQKFWRSFCDLVGRADLEGRWQGPPGGVDYRVGDEPLRAELDGLIATRTSKDWFDAFLDRRIPGCPVLDETALVSSSHTGARGMIRPAPAGAPFPVIANPVAWRSHRDRPGDGHAPSPALDQDRDAVLRDWLA